MYRREFIKMTAGALAATALAGRGIARGSVDVAAIDALHYRHFNKVRRFARTPFGEIAYIDEGRRQRVALFLHGFPLNSFQWRGAIDRLSMYRRCIAPDFLSLGYTRVAPGQSVDPDAQAAMLISLLDTLKIRTVDLVASDSGGAVAQLLVARHPERVRTLLLTNCDSEIDSPPPALLPVIELSKQGQFVDKWLAPWRADKALARSAEGIGGMCYSVPTQPSDAAIEMYFAPLLATPRNKALVHAYAVAQERNALAGIGPQLKRSAVPTRIVWGMQDTIFDAKGAEHLDRTFGQSRGVRRLSVGKLFWPEEYPDILAEEAIRLWNASLLCPDAQCDAPRTGDQLVS
jgi:pimeloyl-ACP methyl ester carboxylesterase